MKNLLILIGLALGTFVSVDFYTETVSAKKILPVEKPNDWFFRQRAYPFHQINHEAYVQALKQSKKQRQHSLSNRSMGSWEFAGPINIGGRITDVEMHASDLNTIYLGAASGGVFKSSDKGQNWVSIFDDALSLSVGDIAIAPSDASVIYVGTGEANAGGGSLAYDGLGVYRSDDAGESWDYIGLESSRNIGRMVVDPNNADILYVAAMGNLFANSSERGIYKTSDGGNTWEKVLYVSDSTGGIDVVIHPTNSNIVYAAMWERVRRPNRRNYGGSTCGLYKSIDGGDSWEELTNGLPQLAQDKGRIGIDISESEPDILYVIYADEVGYFNGVYKTNDGGDNWIRTNDQSLSNSYASYGWWFGRIKVDPADPENAFVIGFDIYRTINGGQSWSNQSGGGVHVDQHAVYIHPENNNFVVLGNDGGLYISNNGGNSWSWNETLPITQFYTCEIDNQMPFRLYGGTQDNGTNRTMTGALDDWELIYGGDGFRVLVDPNNNAYVYAEYQYGGLGRSTNGGNGFTNATSGISSSDRFNWHCPLEFDPINSSTLFFGTNRLYKSTNRALSWSAISNDLTDGNTPGNLAYNTLTTIAVSPINNNIIYTGSDDGNVHITLDGGTNWENISSDLPKRWITKVVADPLEEGRVYVTISGYRWDEFIPHVFRSDDYGQNWVDISSNLPEAPVNDLIVNTPNTEILFVATDMGVYVTYDGGIEWETMGDNLPHVVVNDLVLHKPTNKLVAGTFGRSMYTYDLEQDEITHNTQISEEENLKLYPNPFSEKINIILDQKMLHSTLKVFDRSARLVYLKEIEKEIFLEWDGTDLNGNKLPKGIYFIQIQNNEIHLNKKVILN